MSNITDYNPGAGSYKVEEAGSLKGISSSHNVDNQFGTLTFNNKAFSIKARGLNLALSSKFNSDHLYSTVIRKVTKGEQPDNTETLMTLPGGQTNFYRICNGWSWNLPYIIIGQKNVFKINIGGKIFDLGSVISDKTYGDDNGDAQDFWVESYHVKYEEGTGANHKSLIVTIPEIKVIITCEVLKSGNDYTVDYTDTYPFKIYKANGTVLEFKKTGEAGTGHLCKITDAAEKNSLEYFYTTDGSSISNYIALNGNPKRMGFTLHSGDGAKVKVGDLITVRDETRVIWSKNGDVITVSQGFNFEPDTAVDDKYSISKGQLQKIVHTDGRCVKFYWYTDNSENLPRMTILLSSNETMNQLAEGDLFLKRYTFDINNRLAKIEILNTKNFTPGTFDIENDTTYIEPLYNTTYEYNISNNPSPKTDYIVIKNHAGAFTKYLFQKGGFCVHSYIDGDPIITGSLGSQSSDTHINLRKEPDDLIKTGYIIGCGNEFKEITSIISPTKLVCNAFSEDLEKRNNFVILKALKHDVIEHQGTATKVYINTSNVDIEDLLIIKGQIRTITKKDSDATGTFVIVDSPFTVEPLSIGKIEQDWNDRIDKSLEYAKIAYDKSWNEIEDDNKGDYKPPTRESILEITQSVYPPELGDADEYAVLKKPEFYIYYLNKPKIIKIERKQNKNDKTWKSINYKYLYMKGGNETNDDFSGGGFISDDTDGPSTKKLKPDDIEIIKTSIVTWKEGFESQDYLKKIISFAYTYNKELKGQSVIKKFRSENKKWIATSKVINILGHPCTNADYYGVTSEYHYYGLTEKNSETLGYRYHIDRDYDAYGRVIRSRKYSPSYSGGQAVNEWTQYVGIGTGDNLDPYGVFIDNPFDSTYQNRFDNKLCFEVVGAIITQVNENGSKNKLYKEFNTLLNITAIRVVERAGEIIGKSVFGSNTTFRGQVPGYSLETDKNKIYWSIDGSDHSNNWDDVQWTIATKYGTRDLDTTFTYNNTTNNLEKITKPLGNEINIVYGSDWKSSYIIRDYLELDHNLGDTTQYVVNRFDYDIKGRLIQKKSNLSNNNDGTDPYDNNKYPQSMVEYEYDGMNRLTLKKAGNTSTNDVLKQVYDLDNLLTTTTDFLGFRTKTYYDKFFQPIEIKEFKPNRDTNIDYDTPSANEIQIGWSKFSYDIIFGKVFEKIEYSNNDGADNHLMITKKEYDSSGRLTKTSFKNTDSSYNGNDVFKLLSEIEYDDVNNAILTKSYIDESIDSSFIQTKVEKDWLRRGVVKTFSWPGKNGIGRPLIIKNNYDYAGNLIQKEMPNGDRYQYLYSSLGRLENILYPDGTSSEINFNKNGNIVNTKDRKGFQISYDYNISDMIIKTIAGNIETTSLLTHLGKASIIEKENSDEKVKNEFEYHWSGGITKNIQTIENSIIQVLERTFNNSGNPITIKVTGSGTGENAWSKELNINHQYHPSDPDTDNFNRIALLDGETAKLTKEFDYLKLLNKIKYGTSTAREITYTYDNFLRTLNMISNEGTPELNVVLTRDVLGNILTKEGNTYTYDGMNRLLTGEDEAYTYDELSNLSTRENKKYKYQLSGNDSNQMRLKSFFDGVDTTYTYTYDDNGNVETISNKLSSTVYDNLNRLKQVTHSSKQDNYLYNGNNLRVKREEDATGSSVRTYVMYSGDNPILIEKYNGATLIESRFNLIIGPTILGQIKQVYGTGESYEYFYLDNLQSRRVVLNASGDKIDKFSYSAWGEVTHLYGSNNHLASFTGKEYDDTGFIYFNARYYDPETGRFITEDPSRKGFGWYNYCGNNPINNIDPKGLIDLPICVLDDIEWHNAIVDTITAIEGSSVETVQMNNKSVQVSNIVGHFAEKYNNDMVTRGAIYDPDLKGFEKIRAGYYPSTNTKPSLEGMIPGEIRFNDVTVTLPVSYTLTTELRDVEIDVEFVKTVIEEGFHSYDMEIEGDTNYSKQDEIEAKIAVELIAASIFPEYIPDTIEKVTEEVNDLYPDTIPDSEPDLEPEPEPKPENNDGHALPRKSISERDRDPNGWIGGR